MTKSPPVPAQIGPYQIIREIGKGGYARVYLGEDDQGGRFAIKLHFRNRKKALRRFYREFSILSEQDHPALPRAHQFGEQDGSPWMSMQWVHGETAISDVRMFGRAGSNPRIYRAKRIMTGVADALIWLHSQNILHCDIKPGNVLVRPNGTITLVDFGAARWMDPQTHSAKSIRFVGTRSYAAIELLSAQPTTPRTDIFSMGVMAYKLLTGRRPYPRGNADTAIEFLLKADPTPPLVWCPGIAPSLSRLVMEMLQLKPESRPKSAKIVSQRLRSEH